MRSFGIEISENRGRGCKLSKDQRSGILSTVEAGESKAELARRYCYNRSTIYDIIKRWNVYKRTETL
ncbi:hypothetical protein CC78DRAFT_479832 [Lojkania enalia]|uniref:Resolvase HTH domain-containing protein n=1 Tax=Lojkania enalia TaxID=147567 RepID=A0A9P4JYL4_9PLEO|nr:hypothetical protein CC78DRAFT_479832 [Didymosphaeria enalia]